MSFSQIARWILELSKLHLVVIIKLFVQCTFRDSAIMVVGTKEIIPAMVFAKIGRYSAYIEHYYMHTPNTMTLIVEPISKP